MLKRNLRVFFNTCFLLYFCVDIIQYFCFLLRVKPLYLFVPLEPCHLFTRVNTRILFYLFDGKRQFPGTIQIIEHFFVSYGVERVESTVGIYASCFFKQSFFYHDIYPAVDTVVKFGTVTGQSYLDNAKRALLFLLRTKRGISLPCHVTNLKRMNHAFGIL